MTGHLPPLTAVRAFEAAARKGSVTLAADELCVTPAAVTHQVRSLERWLGVNLFSRKGSVLKLTSAGDTFFVGANKGIEAIRFAAEQVAAPSNKTRLSVVAPPSFAAQWLVPRLSSFRASQKVELLVAIRNSLVETAWQTTDVGIVSGVETPHFLERRPVMRFRILAVCSPKLVEGQDGIKSFKDLARHQLLHDEGLKVIEGVDWDSWLRAAGHTDIDTSGGVRFNNAFAAYRYAIDGHGIVLAKDILVRKELESGQLVCPFDIWVDGKTTYDFVCTQSSYRTKAVSQFWDWLNREAKQDGSSYIDKIAC